MPKWKGPFMVVRKFGMAYEVLVTPKTSRVYHYDLQTAHHGSNAPQNDWSRLRCLPYKGIVDKV